MSRKIKGLMIASIHQAMSGTKDLFVVDLSRVSAVSVNRMRLDLADHNIKILCVKNAIASRALLELGLNSAQQAFIGSSALAYGTGDVVAISRELIKCKDLYKTFSVRSGIVDRRVLSSGDVDTLSKSPGKSELQSHLSACILSTGQVILNTIGSYQLVASQIVSLTSRK